MENNNKAPIVEILGKKYDYNSLSKETKKSFLLYDDVRRDLAFHHARADMALLKIKEELEKAVQNETPLSEEEQEKDNVVKVKIFDKIYDYESLSKETKQLFILQDDIRRDLAFNHARAEKAISKIKEELEEFIKKEKPIE